MALNFDALGKKIGPLTKEYGWKDPVLYALGVGAGFSELEYCYEKDLKVLPTFSMAAIIDFFWQAASASNLNPAGVLHGEQELIFHNPIPGDGKMVTEGAVTRYYDKGEGKGALVVSESDTVHSSGKKLFTSVITLFARLDGGFGGENAPKDEVAIPDRAPDTVAEAGPSADQPLLYRLSGDVFQLHADPEFARMSGFEKPIMHGLCTLGFACRALIKTFVPGEPEKVRRLKCRFSKPLYPGTPIKTLIWKIGDGRALWRTVNAENGDVIIDRGIFEYGDIPEAKIPKTEIRFDGKVAIVTGAGAGLGRTYALALAKRGAKVVVNDLGGAKDGLGQGSASPADRVVGEITAQGGQAVANHDSVADPQGAENIVKTALDAFGTVDILINNAGILRDKSLVKMEPEDWQAVMDVHLNGAYNVTRSAFAVMKENGYGRIVMTTSAAGLYGNFGQTNYSAAKMGLVGFMNALKIEGDKYNIKVNAVAPAATTRLTEEFFPPDMKAAFGPELVSPMTLCLCSDKCPVSGNIYNAGMGFYNRAAVVTGPGVVLGDKTRVPTPETISDNWKKITSLEKGKEYWTLNEMVGDVITACSKPPEKSEAREKGFSHSSVALGFDSVASVFDAMPGAFVAEAGRGLDVVFQYTISGNDAGDWYCAVKDGSCEVSAGTHGKPTCTLKIADADFLRMMNGTLPPMQAYTSGKLKIGGDIMKSQLIEKLFKMK